MESNESSWRNFRSTSEISSMLADRCRFFNCAAFMLNFDWVSFFGGALVIAAAVAFFGAALALLPLAFWTRTCVRQNPEESSRGSSVLKLRNTHSDGNLGQEII